MNDVETIAKPMTEDQLLRHLIEGRDREVKPELLEAFLDLP